MGALLTNALVALVALAAPNASTADEPTAADRVFYLYSPDSAEQRLRAARLWRDYGDGRLLAIARDGRRAAGQPALTVLAAAQSPLVPEYLKARLGAKRDYFALTGPGGEVRLTGRGVDLRALAPPATPTEVDESTWGKVKDLFR